MVRKFTVTDLKKLYENHFYERISEHELTVDAYFEQFFDWLEEVDDELR